MQGVLEELLCQPRKRATSREPHRALPVDECQPQTSIQRASGQGRKHWRAGCGLRSGTAAGHAAVYWPEHPRGGYSPECEPMHAVDGRVPSHIGGPRCFERTGWGQINGITRIGLTSRRGHNVHRDLHPEANEFSFFAIV